MGKEDAVHIYDRLLLTHKKRSEIGSFVAMWMNLESYTVKSEKEKQIPYVNAYMWNLEKWYR